MTTKESLNKIISRNKQRSLNTPLRIAIVILLIGIITGSYQLYHALRPTPYVATRDGFQIVFHGNPTIHKINFKSSGSSGSQTGRIYNYLDSSTNVDYAVSVVSESGLNASSLSTATTEATLEAAVDQLSQTDSAVASNARISNFEGLLAAEATLTPSDQSDAPSYVIAFLHKDDLYLIIGSGLGQTKFDSFANTFHFI